MERNLKSYALEGLGAGLSIVPPMENGSKRPVGEWKLYQERLPTTQEIEEWYADHRTGIGIVCGGVSGNLEMMEFEDQETYAAYIEHARATDKGWLVDMIEQGYCEESPNGGRHWLYRCPEIEGNKKLAQAENKKVLIETRGQGGYVIVAPSNGHVHPTDRPYLLLSGRFGTIANISKHERAQLHQLARTFDRTEQATGAGSPTPVARPSDESPAYHDRPGDDYNRRGSWQELLEAHGWTLAYTRGEIQYWRRPDKRDGWSATVGHQHDAAGNPALWVFSTSTGFEADRVYDKFGAYTILNFKSNSPEAVKAATRELGEKGYGEPAQKPARQSTQQQSTDDEVFTVGLDTITIEPIRWLWASRLPLGKVSIIEGDPDSGKSTITLDIAARVSSGTNMPLEFKGPQDPGGVVLVCAEDDLSDTIIPRVLSHGGDVSRIGSVTLQRDEQGELMPLALPEDMRRLRGAIRNYKAKLLVIDPITAYLSAAINSNNDPNVRRATTPLAELAQQNSCAVLLVRHLNKSGELKAKYRGGGSIAFTGAARSVLVVDQHPEEDDVWVMARVKGNLAERNVRSLTYSIGSDDRYDCPHITWRGHDKIDADALLKGKDAREDAPQRDEAEEFLRAILSGGAMKAADIKKEAIANSISESTLKRAKAKVGVVAHAHYKPTGGFEFWIWELPE